MASAGHNRIWYFSSSTSISNIAFSGRVKTYPIPVAGVNPVYGNDGNIWFLAGSKIGRFSPAGSSSYFDATGFTNGALTPGFGNDVWFPEQMAAESPPAPQPVIAHMTSNGTVTTYQQPTDICSQGAPFCQVRGITRGPDGNVWFSGKIDFCPFCGLLGKINPVTGAVSLEGNGVGSYGNLVVGPDKRLWTIALEPGPGFNQAHLVSFDTNFALSKDYLLPSQSEVALTATGLTAGRDALYLIGGAVILRVTTSGQITTFSPPSQIPCCPNSIIASGPKDDIWFSVEPFNGPPSGIGVLRQNGSQDE